MEVMYGGVPWGGVVFPWRREVWTPFSTEGVNDEVLHCVTPDTFSLLGPFHNQVPANGNIPHIEWTYSKLMNTVGCFCPMGFLKIMPILSITRI